MSEEIKTPNNEVSFWDKVNWDIVTYNKISREDFFRIKAKNKKSYGTLLGEEQNMQFYLFKPLNWGEYRDIKQKDLDKQSAHEYILNNCVLWPKLDPVTLNNLEAGIVTTLVYQILSVSLFLSDPSKALEMIIEV